MPSDAVRPPFDRRLAPRPLGFHLAMSSATWLGAAAALPAFVADSAPLQHSLKDEAAILRRRLSDAGPDAVTAVLAEAQGRIARMLQGITLYQQHPHRRRTILPPPLFRCGQLTLRDYAPDSGAPGLFAVPSLINPSYILDLDENLSLMRFLARQTLRPFLVDWGAPCGDERSFSIEDYVCRRLEPALAAAAAATGGPQIVLGYCMGGNLAIALALRRPDLVRGLVLIATPWDFHAEGVALTRALTNIMSGTLAVLPPGEPVPLDLLQVFFASLDFTLSDRKFRRFATLDPDSVEARRFVVIEDWANDGEPLARKAAEDCLYGWYGRNDPGCGTWTIAGTRIDPGALRMPVLVAIPRSDRIVPPLSALAVTERLREPYVIKTGTGHVAMIVGRDAERELGRPLAGWCRGLAEC